MLLARTVGVAGWDDADLCRLCRSDTLHGESS